MTASSAGPAFRTALAEEAPLQCVGVLNAYTARQAHACGYRALYLSGGGVAAGSLGYPDLGITGLEDVLIDVRRIVDLTISRVSQATGLTRRSPPQVQLRGRVPPHPCCNRRPCLGARTGLFAGLPLPLIHMIYDFMCSTSNNNYNITIQKWAIFQGCDRCLRPAR